MKRMKSNYRLLESQINFKLFNLGFIIFFIIITFSSCSNDDESLSKSGETKNKSKSEEVNSKDKTQKSTAEFIQENVNSFSQTIFLNNDRLDYALSQNLYVGFNAQSMQMLSAAQNESDLKIVFEGAGIANSQEIIDILKSNVEAQQTFINQSMDFYGLTIDQQVEYLKKGVEISNNNYIIAHGPAITSGYASARCATGFNTTVGRCAEDFGTCAVFAVAGAYAGLAPGLLGAAYCMTTKIVCDRRAIRDFKDCEAKEIILNGATGSTEVYTKACDRDSCWSIDANGKYIGFLSW